MKKAFPYAFKACDLGWYSACVNVSVMYRNGQGVDKDLKESERFARIAKDIQQQHEASRERIAFQEGAETIGWHRDKVKS